MRIMPCLLMLIVSLFSVALAMAEVSRPARLSGAFAYKDGRPLSSGMIYLYDHAAGPPPIIEKYWRVPDQVAEVDEQGHFDLEVPPGIYFLTYIKRADQLGSGPPRRGDVILLSLDSKEQPVAYSLKAGEKLDIGMLAGGVVFDSEMVRTVGKDITAIAGRVVGEEGLPISGAAVFAFTTPSAVGRPLFVSDLSDSDGRFLLRVSQGGTYYIKVRSKHGGGQPSQDSVLDGVKGEQLIKITVATGEIAKGVIHKELTLRGPKSKRKTMNGP